LSNEKKNVSQSKNNLERKINPKPQMNQRPFVKKAIRSRSIDYTLATKIESKNCKIYKERLSIPENQLDVSFKLINQSINGIRSSSQEIEAKLGEKRQIGSLQQFLQESSQDNSGAQCCYHSKSHSQIANESKLGSIEIKILDWFCGLRKRKQGRERKISCCK
jgi:hypothetical protein